MIQLVNERRAAARVLHTIEDLLKAPMGSLWREAPMTPSQVGAGGGNPPYVMATGSGKEATAYVAFGLDDGSGYTTDDDHGVFLPSEHQPNFPLFEVTDGTFIRIG